MAINRGKQFEQKFKEDWSKSFPNTFILRLPDQVSGYKFASANICDYICFDGKKLYLIECKSHKGTTFPFSCLRQYDKLICYKDKENIIAGCIVWYTDFDKVIFAPISTIEQMIKDNKKSINIKDIDKYNIIVIPSIKKRVFLDSDYTILKNI